MGSMFHDATKAAAMTDAKATYENGIYRVGDVRLSDLAGRRMLPVAREQLPHGGGKCRICR